MKKWHLSDLRREKLDRVYRYAQECLFVGIYFGLLVGVPLGLRLYVENAIDLGIVSGDSASLVPYRCMILSWILLGVIWIFRLLLGYKIASREISLFIIYSNGTVKKIECVALSLEKTIAGFTCDYALCLEARLSEDTPNQAVFQYEISKGLTYHLFETPYLIKEALIRDLAMQYSLKIKHSDVRVELRTHYKNGKVKTHFA